MRTPDVDDLADISELEKHVEESVLVLCFLSKGYFLSANSMREVRAAIALKKPILAVHEEDPSHGGATLQAIRNECPADIAHVFFGPRADSRAAAPVTWLRTRAMQLASLALIAETLVDELDALAESKPEHPAHVAMLEDGRDMLLRLAPADVVTTATLPAPLGTSQVVSMAPCAVRIARMGGRVRKEISRKLRLRKTKSLTSWLASGAGDEAGSSARKGCRLIMDGATTHLQHVFAHSPTPILYVSPSNLGAMEVARMLQRATDGLKVVSTPPRFTPVVNGGVKSMADFKVTEPVKSSWRKSGRRGSIDESKAKEKGGRRKSRMSIKGTSATNELEAADPGSLACATHWLVYLNMDTFGDATDGATEAARVQQLVNELRWNSGGQRLDVKLNKKVARQFELHSSSVAIVLVHETRAAFGGCEFDRFFACTPVDLAKELYKTMAVPLHANERHVAVALSQLARTLGAKTRPAALNAASPTPLSVVRSGSEVLSVSAKDGTGKLGSALENESAVKLQAAFRGKQTRTSIAQEKEEAAGLLSFGQRKSAMLPSAHACAPIPGAEPQPALSEYV